MPLDFTSSLWYHIDNERAHRGAQFTLNLDKSATTRFDVIRAGKVVESFDTYEAAWKYARQWKSAMVRYFIKKK